MASRGKLDGLRRPRACMATAALLLAASLVSPVAAQSPTPTPAESSTAVAPITVVGRQKITEANVGPIVAHFVDQHAARDKKTGLLVRAPPSGVCPSTQGLSPAFDAFVTARIIEVAKTVQAPVAKDAKCTPNVEVMFTEAPQALVDDLAKRSGGGFLGVRYLGEEHALSRVTRPIQAWYMTGTVSDVHPEATRLVDSGNVDSIPTGIAGGFQPSRPADFGPPADAVTDHAYWPSPFSGTGSHFAPRHSSQFTNVLIVADLNKLDGREIGPMADYIAMLALAQAKSLDACNTLPSILDMLAAGCPDRPAPPAMTDSDIAFLKALYAADLTRTVDSGRFHVEQAMAKDVLAPKP